MDLSGKIIYLKEHQVAEGIMGKEEVCTFIRPLILSSSYLTLLPLPISITCHYKTTLS